MRILFITANRIGDAVLTTGVLAHLVERYPGARFTIAVGPAAADLFRAVPGLEKLIVMKKQPRNKHWIALWRACVGTRWDLIVDLRNSFVSRLLWAHKRAFRPAHATGRHKVFDNAQALALDPPPAPRLWLDEAARHKGLAALGNLGDAPLLALAPAANWPAKQWPASRFAALAQQIEVELWPDVRFLILAAPHEKEQIAPLLAALDPSRLIVPSKLDLLEVAGALSYARLFIGNDSGLMHIASALGVPTLGLFGPGYEKIYGPWGEKASVVRTPENSEELLARLPYPGAFAPNLMESLSVARVFEEVCKKIPR